MLNNVPQIGRTFAVEGKIGEGTFSKVYKARLLKDRSKEYALKFIIPTIRPQRISTELRFLRDVGGDSNVIGVKGFAMHRGHTVIVMENFVHDKFSDYVSDLTVDEVREYIRNLLIALQKIHSQGIIHRDIKPSNFLYNRAAGTYALVDFGLAQKEKDLARPPRTSTRFANFGTARYSLGVQQTKLSFNVLEKPEKRVVKLPESAAHLLRKKRQNEDCGAHSRKRVRSSDGDEQKEAPPSSTVFNTPCTPTCPPVPKPPSNTPDRRDNGENVAVFKTPTKSVRAKRKDIIPETPSRSQQAVPDTPPNTSAVTGEVKAASTARNAVKTKLRFEAKNYDTPKGRWQDSKVLAEAKCDCFQKGQVCRICIRKNELFAPRAGTPGFRAPEVLLKSLEQTTAIDIWSAGVVFASLLSGRYPFFRNVDDMTALAEIIILRGSKRLFKAARQMGRAVSMPFSEKPPLDLKLVCTKMRPPTCQIDLPDSAYDLLDQLLDPNPLTRPTATQALNHEFLQRPQPKREPSPVMVTDESAQMPMELGNEQPQPALEVDEALVKRLREQWGTLMSNSTIITT